MVAHSQPLVGCLFCNQGKWFAPSDVTVIMVGFLAQTHLLWQDMSCNGPSPSALLCPPSPQLSQNTCIWRFVGGQRLPLDPGEGETPDLAPPEVGANLEVCLDGRPEEPSPICTHQKGLM